MAKPSLPSGTRDFSAAVVRKRNFILHTIRSVFEVYGFGPLETPAMENLETLMGKYGEEGDKLIFKILNNGLDNPEKEKQVREEWEKLLAGKSSKAITERALRYDLTIPFARYVATHQQQLAFPFKRYQIQPVWRADRPQKGRYREFYQCDADVVGSRSLLNEIELGCICHTVFNKLGIQGYSLRVNHRLLLSALATQCGGPDKLTSITIAIDKLDKIGLEKVKKELQDRALNNTQIAIIEQYLSLQGDDEEIIDGLAKLLGENEEAKKGIHELRYVLHALKQQGVRVQIDPTLARGLNYYTGMIFEMKAPEGVTMGSIGGGGRYDDLTGLFEVPGIPGIGISFGVDRIYDVMEELLLFPDTTVGGTQLLFFNLGDQEAATAFELMQQLRSNGIATELFPENLKFDKQFKYAEKKGIPYIVIIGEKELADQEANIKNIVTGEQRRISLASMVSHQFDW
ncbi:MAG: histidine--tRNA ligase [Chitinophagaceae bacterium]